MLIYVLLIIAIVLLLVILIKLYFPRQANLLLDPLTAKIDTLPPLVDEKFANRLLHSDNKLQVEFNNLKATLANDVYNLQLKLLSQLNESTSRLNTNMVAGLTDFQIATLRQEKQANEELINKFNEFSLYLKNSLNADVEKLVNVLRLELDKLNQKVEDKLRDGFENTTKTFNNVLERLTRIDAAQKKIDELSVDIVSLQNILTDKKSRGIFGEVQLNHILIAAFGENNHTVFAIQHKLSNSTLADAVVFSPEPLGKIVIDSKFPLENYRKMIDTNLTLEERNLAKKEFEVNVKKHIDDIANKYIIIGETANQAVMFIPAEAIFAQINAYHYGLVEYSYNKRVWLASPTTLMAQMTTLLVVLRNMEREKHAKIIHENLAVLSLEFGRYKDRWDKLSSHLDTVSKDVKDLHTTSQKIGNRFEKIAKVDIEQLPQV